MRRNHVPGKPKCKKEANNSHFMIYFLPTFISVTHLIELKTSQQTYSYENILDKILFYQTIRRVIGGPRGRAAATNRLRDGGVIYSSGGLDLILRVLINP